MCVPCVSTIEIQTTGPISMKFGMSILLNGGRFIAGIQPPTPGVRGALTRVCPASAASTVQFGKNFILYKTKVVKTKVVGCPCFSGGVTFLDPEGPGPHVILEPWSDFIKQKL
jgi:hypothetical protein